MGFLFSGVFFFQRFMLVEDIFFGLHTMRNYIVARRRVFKDCLIVSSFLAPLVVTPITVCRTIVMSFTGMQCVCAVRNIFVHYALTELGEHCFIVVYYSQYNAVNL